jgi:hypothetical protein
MRQELRVPRGYRTDNVTRIETRLRRNLISEVAFIGLPNNAGWLGFRHVKSVNGKPVTLAEASLTTLLAEPGMRAARTLLNESAAHNLGLPRTTNLPNLPLEFLHARNRHRFLSRLDGQETVRGARATRLVMIERVTPSLIRNPDTGADMPSVVHAWIDPRNGRLLRAEVTTFTSSTAKEPENDLRVEFVDDRTLAILVPSEMRELFPGPEDGTGTAVARYTNFRRFTTSARILPR